jgi:hypothetical protein
VRVDEAREYRAPSRIDGRYIIGDTKPGCLTRRRNAVSLNNHHTVENRWRSGSVNDRAVPHDQCTLGYTKTAAFTSD